MTRSEWWKLEDIVFYSLCSVTGLLTLPCAQAHRAMILSRRYVGLSGACFVLTSEKEAGLSRYGVQVLRTEYCNITSEIALLPHLDAGQHGTLHTRVRGTQYLNPLWPGWRKLKMHPSPDNVPDSTQCRHMHAADVKCRDDCEHNALFGQKSVNDQVTSATKY